jgi:hypothetical protein
VTEFEKFCEQVHAAMRLHGLDAGKLSLEDLWRSYRRGDDPHFLAELTSNLMRQEAEMARPCRRR